MTEEPKGRIGSAFDDFLKDEGIFEEVQAGALKKVVAHHPGRGDARKAGRFCVVFFRARFVGQNRALTRQFMRAEICMVNGGNST